jgi:ribosomal protein S6
MTTEVGGFYNWNKWNELGSVCMELQASIKKNGEAAYSFRYFLSNLTGIKEIARAIRLHWGVIILRR